MLIPNDDPAVECYGIRPRGGSFELSTVAEDGKNPSADILLYSKIIGKMWPNSNSVAQKLSRYWECKEEGLLTPQELKERFTFNPQTLAKSTTRSTLKSSMRSIRPATNATNMTIQKNITLDTESDDELP